MWGIPGTELFGDNLHTDNGKRECIGVGMEYSLRMLVLLQLAKEKIG